MLPKSVSHYCQRCLAANPFGQEFCARCGTRLMLVVEPSATRYDEAIDLDASCEEHLLERVSILENRLARLTGKLEQSLDLLLRQARNSYFDHALIETLINVLGEAGTIDAEKLDCLWRKRCQLEVAEQDEKDRREELRLKIIASYRGAEQSAFAQLINEGFELLADSRLTRGIRSLERAAALAPENAPLLFFLGEHFFRAGKTQLARAYLTRAHESAPDNYGICLLLGLVCGDEGETEQAKKLLIDAAERGAAGFAIHYGLGRLLAAEQKWPDALTEFKRALAARPSAEAHYVVGCVYYQLGRDRMAARYLNKAIDLDADYAAAFYILGLVYLRAGERKRAKEAFSMARVVGKDEPRYRALSINSAQASDPQIMKTLFGAARYAGRRLMTGGDRRLADTLREDALSAVARAQ